MVKDGPRRRHWMWILAYLTMVVLVGTYVIRRIGENSFSVGSAISMLFAILLTGALWEEVRQYLRQRKSPK